MKAIKLSDNRAMRVNHRILITGPRLHYFNIKKPVYGIEYQIWSDSTSNFSTVTSFIAIGKDDINGSIKDVMKLYKAGADKHVEPQIDAVIDATNELDDFNFEIEKIIGYRI